MSRAGRSRAACQTHEASRPCSCRADAAVWRGDRASRAGAVSAAVHSRGASLKGGLHRCKAWRWRPRGPFCQGAGRTSMGIGSPRPSCRAAPQPTPALPSPQGCGAPRSACQVLGDARKAGRKGCRLPRGSPPPQPRPQAAGGLHRDRDGPRLTRTDAFCLEMTRAIKCDRVASNCDMSFCASPKLPAFCEGCLRRNG